MNLTITEALVVNRMGWRTDDEYELCELARQVLSREKDRLLLTYQKQKIDAELQQLSGGSNTEQGADLGRGDRARQTAGDIKRTMAMGVSYGTNYTGGADIEMYRNPYTRECALAAVELIMTALDENGSWDSVYWESVKRELEK